MIAQLLTFLIAFAYAFSPELAGFENTLFAVVAHLIGPLVSTLAVASCFPSFAGLRLANNWIGVALALSPIAAFFIHAPPAALVIQAIAGLWIAAFSMLAKPIHETGGWRRALKHVDELDIDWA